MRTIGLALLALAVKDNGGDRVTLNQIEERLRTVSGEAQAVVKAKKAPAGAAAGLAVLVTVALTYLLGRRRGRKRATVLEIRRV
ncbi:MAG: hypothetical protein JWM85_2291 [Acidimicrobiaceae bacterium]|nr:hypothetical protein [Acidimicrobiaceae bacterium]